MAIDARLVDAFERLVSGAVGITTVTLAELPSAMELTLPQWRALVVIAAGDGLRVGEVGGRLRVALPAASRLVRRLERRGLVVTERDERDRRATIVRATDAGRLLRAEILERRRARLAAILAGLPGPLPDTATTTLEDLAMALAGLG